MNIETTISLVANLAIALSFLVAVIFGLAQVKAAAQDRKERLTLDTIRNFQTREFAELLYHLNVTDPPASQEEFRNMPADVQIMFIQLSQEMESLGILVAEGLVDLDLVDKTIGSLVTSAWDKYSLALLDMRERIPDPYLGEYFQWLARQVDDRLTNNARPPYYTSS